MATSRVSANVDDAPLCRCAIFQRFFELGIDNKTVERQEEFLDIKAAANVLGKAEKTAYAMVADGRAAGIKVGGRWLVHLPSTLSLVTRSAVWSVCRDCAIESGIDQTSRDSRVFSNSAKSSGRPRSTRTIIRSSGSQPPP